MSKRVTTVFLAVVVVLAISMMSLSLTSALDFGSNWTAQYFNNINLSGSPVLTQTVQAVNFTWTGSPATNVDANNFSIRFTSNQVFNDGTYQFIVAVDDGVRVFIDGVSVLDQWGQVTAVKTYQFNQTMTAGNHSLQVEMVDYAGSATIQFQWTLVSAGTAAPAATAGPSPTPGPTSTPAPTGLPQIPSGAVSATVIRAAVLNVRSAPFLGATRVGHILRGQTYAVVGRDERAYWFLLQLSNTQAWAWGYYLYIDGNEFNAPVVSPFVLQGEPASLSGVVGQTHATLKLRASPTIDSPQIGRIPWGDLLPIIGRTRYNDWYQVEWRNTIGWVFAPYVSVLRGDIATVPVTG